MLNKVMIIGHLGADPEKRFTQGGKAVATMSVATTEKWKDKDGQQNEKTEWHRVVAWDRLAEVCSEYLNRGSRVYIEGKIQTKEWQDKEGNKRYTTEIICNQMQMLGGGQARQDNDHGKPESTMDESVPF